MYWNKNTKKIVRKLMRISHSFYAPEPPLTRIVTEELSELVSEIKNLPYGEFLEVFRCVGYITLPHDFKKKLELDYEIRGKKTFFK
jgi:hypothetical protein